MRIFEFSFFITNSYYTYLSVLLMCYEIRINSLNNILSRGSWYKIVSIFRTIGGDTQWCVTTTRHLQ